MLAIISLRSSRILFTAAIMLAHYRRCSLLTWTEQFLVLISNKPLKKAAPGSFAIVMHVQVPKMSTSGGTTPTCTHFWCYVGHGGDVLRRSSHQKATAVPVPIGLKYEISSTINKYFMIGHDLKISSTGRCGGFLATRTGQCSGVSVDGISLRELPIHILRQINRDPPDYQ